MVSVREAGQQRRTPPETPVSTAIQQNCLLLNADYKPIKVIDWERAITMLLDDTAEMVENYTGMLVRSATLALPWPAVLRLKRYVRDRTRIRFTRQNVLARDNFACAYCGVRPVKKDGKPDLGELTLDHIVPRAQSKSHTVKLPWNGKTVPVTCWENVVACCQSCNSSKADRTPAQAGMTLHSTPKAPNATDILRMTLYKVLVPSEWTEWLPEGWRGPEGETYWDVELDPT
jgi:5-methylcytosine-specific restriction endonuclease McrA